MIDFACKRFNLDEIIKCGLGLTKTDYFILKFLVEHKTEFSSEAVAKGIEVDLSTAQRSLKKLREKELILRRQVNLDSGGYVFLYRGKPKEEVKKLVLDIVSNWGKGVENALNRW